MVHERRVVNAAVVASDLINCAAGLHRSISFVGNQDDGTGQDSCCVMCTERYNLETSFAEFVSDPNNCQNVETIDGLSFTAKSEPIAAWLMCSGYVKTLLRSQCSCHCDTEVACGRCMNDYRISRHQLSLDYAFNVSWKSATACA